VKFSFRQILASAAGAVIAALIASSFGVTGTIVGVAIGSMAATMGTALVSQSIERGHKAVKQVVVRVPDGPTSTLLRRMGGTGAAGGSTSTVDGAPQEAAPTEVVGAVGGDTTEIESAAAPVGATQGLEISAAADAPPSEHLQARTVPKRVVRGGRDRDGGDRFRFTWKAMATTAGIVFAVALVFITVVELIADKPLASIFGSTGNGPSLGNIFTPSSPTTTTTPTTVPTTSPSTTAPTSTTTTTSTTTASSTTTTSVPGTTTTSTTNLGATTTTAARSGTTTTVAKP
jgi:hypothetical protein